MMKIFNNDRMLLPSVVTHVFFFFIIISSIIVFVLTQRYFDNTIVTIFNFVNLSCASIIIGVVVKQKWRYRIRQSSFLWLSIFTFKLIITPMFELLITQGNLSMSLSLILSLGFLAMILSYKLFKLCFISGGLIGGFLFLFIKGVVNDVEISEYSHFLFNELFIIFSCIVKVLGIFVLIYYKQIETEIKVESMRTFSNVIAHEIFSPLGVIETALGFLSTHADKSINDAVKLLLRNCRNTRDRINFMMENIKLVGATYEFNVNSFSVHEIMEECVNEYRNNSLDVSLIAHNDIHFFGCKSIMKCIAQNILNNAFQHGGKNVKVEVLITGNYLIFQDNGKGVKSGDLNNIFNMFSTSTKHNLGLGLAVCKNIIESYGGEISCISLEGSHATFIIKFL